MNWLTQKAAVVIRFNDGQGNREVLGSGGRRIKFPLACLTAPVDFPNAGGLGLSESYKRVAG